MPLTRQCASCGVLIKSNGKPRCPACELAYDRRRRPGSSRRGYDAAYRRNAAVIRRYAIDNRSPCALCGHPLPPTPELISVDHIVPLSLGGTSDIDNLRACHPRCNTARSNRPGLTTDIGPA